MHVCFSRKNSWIYSLIMFYRDNSLFQTIRRSFSKSKKNLKNLKKFSFVQRGLTHDFVKNIQCLACVFFHKLASIYCLIMLERETMPF